MRDYVRMHEDLEEEDLDNTLLDAWALDGYTRIHRLVATYPFYKGTETLDTVAGTNAYDHTRKRIEAIYGDDGVLTKIGQNEAMRKYWSQGVRTGKPVTWSTEGGQVYLWPQADDVYSFTLTGSRVPTPWPTEQAAEEPDLPSDFHQLVRSWMLHRALLQQDDGERAAAELSHFQSLLGELVTDEIRADIAEPLLIGGSRKSTGFPPGSMGYDYDSLPS